MTEGGYFPWKMQRILTVPVARYNNLQGPTVLSDNSKLPEGMKWEQDPETREWRLVPIIPVVNDDWDMLDDEDGEQVQQVKSSNSSFTNSGIFVSKSGISVKSHNLLNNKGLNNNIQRSQSNSTIDSNDLGPSGKGVLGVDYLEHIVLPTDTIQGICLTYKINATKLRQANHFSGTSLFLAPKKLVIPISKKALQSGFIRMQDTDAKEFKLHALVAEFPELSSTEARAYLELADWQLTEAVLSAKEDLDWERSESNMSNSNNALKPGQIRFTPANKDAPFMFHARGVGIRNNTATIKEEDNEEQVQGVNKISYNAETALNRNTKVPNYGVNSTKSKSSTGGALCADV